MTVTTCNPNKSEDKADNNSNVNITSTVTDLIDPATAQDNDDITINDDDNTNIK